MIDPNRPTPHADALAEETGAAEPSASETDPSIEITRLANGVQVVTDRMEGLASVSLGVWIGAGARHESAEQNGVAHFLEHMAFKGTDRRTARGIAEEIEDVGGYLNAYTSREATAYYARVLAEDAPLAFDILADILRAPRMAPDDVDVERSVILQEIGQALDTPDDIIFDWAQETAYPDQPIGRPILGPAANVSRFDRAELQGFMAAEYAPDRMIVAAAGAVEHGAVVAMAERYFGDMRPVASAAPAAARYLGGERRVDKPLEQAHLILALPGVGYRDKAFFASQIAATLLGGGMSSRLFQEAREARGLCYSIFAQSAHYADGGVASVYAGTGGAQTADLLGVVADQLRDVAAGPRPEEVARARAQIRAGLLMGLESPASRCERAARALLAQGRVAPIAELLAEIDAVDASAAAAVVEASLKGGAPTLTLYGPVASAPSFDAFAARLAA